MPEKYNDDQYYSEIENLKRKLTHLVDNCLHNMSVEHMETISSRMGDLMTQGMFWLKAENPKRFAYDLREFTSWLVEFIGDKEREFWNE